MPEFNLIPDLLTYINDKYTANGGADEQLITAAELLKGVRGLKEFIQQRGSKVLDSTSDFASTLGADTWLAIVKNNGIYAYSDSGTADGIETFAALTTGFYTLISRFPPKTVSGTFNLASPASVVIPAGTSINKILFSAALDNTVQIGTTNSTGDIESDIMIPGSEPYPFLKPLWYINETTIYFNGATSQVNFKILFD